MNLMDEVDLDEFLKEASKAIDDADNLSLFIQEKATTAIERFLVSPTKCVALIMTRQCADILRFQRIIFRKCLSQLRSVI